MTDFVDAEAPVVELQRDRALERARWELAALTGRLRMVEAERDDWRGRHDAVVSDRNRHRDLVRARQRSNPQRVGRALTELARDPMRTVQRLRRRPAVLLPKPGPTDGPVPSGAAPRRRPAVPVPAHVYLAFGLAHEDLGAFLRAVRQRVVVDADHVPVVVTDCPSFRQLRTPGVVLEYVPDAGTWQRHRPETGWDDVLAERLARLFADHGCARTVIVDRDDPPTLADLLRTT
jgi:hypothetical protein